MAFRGTKVSRAVPVGASTGELVTAGYIAIARSDFYWVSAWSFLRARTAGTYKMVIREYDAANALLATTTLPISAVQTEWTRLTQMFGPNTQYSPTGVVWNASTTKIKVAFFADGSPSGTWDVDGIQVERGKLITAYAPTPQELMDTQVGTTQIADDAVTTPKLIANAVTAAKIAALTITANEIAAGAITTSKLAAGAITLFDEYGQTSLTPSGFSGAWQGFISEGLYNSSFRLGVAGTLHDGRTSDLPFWTVSRSSMSSMNIVNDSAWPGGKYVEGIPSAQDGQFTLRSDIVPIIGGDGLILTAVCAGVCAGGSVPLYYGGIDFYAADGTTFLETKWVNLLTINATETRPNPSASGVVVAPVGARYARAIIEANEYAAHSGSTRLRVGGASLRHIDTIGMQPSAWPLGTGAFTGFNASTTLPNDRAYIMPFVVDQYLDVQSVKFLSTDTNLGRSVEIRLYFADEASSNILHEVIGCHGELVWTGSAVGPQSIPVLATPRIKPGHYWMGIRARNAYGVGINYQVSTAAGLAFGGYHDAHGAFSDTLDMNDFSDIPNCMGMWIAGWSGNAAWG